MKIEFNTLNKIALFWDLNQWDKEWSRYGCTFFASAIGLKYNCWIELNEDDLELIAEKQYNKWKFNYKKGWYGNDWINAVLDFVKEHKNTRGWNVPNLITFKKEDTEKLKEWINRGYMVTIWIWVNKEFPKDARDWKIENYEDYKNYKWYGYKHFTNITKWTWRFTLWKDKYKDLIVDSYAFNKKDNEWLYECDIDEILEDIAMNTKYILF